MKFLNSFLYAVFLLVAICAVLCFAKPKFSIAKVPIELKFFDYGHNSDRCTYDNYDYNHDYYDYHYQHNNECQFKPRLMFERVVEGDQKSNDSNRHAIRYALGKREVGDALLFTAREEDPNHEYSASKLHWNRKVRHSGETSITAIAINITQTSTLGKAYLGPGGNQFLLGIELTNARPLDYDIKVYGFHTSYL